MLSRMALDIDTLLGNLHVYRSSRVPMYHQLADQLRELIDERKLKPNDTLPAEGKIATTLDVSKAVVQDALDVLAGEGKIVRRKGAATKVAAPPPVRIIGSDRYKRTLEVLREKGGDHPLSSAFTEDHGLDWDQYREHFSFSVAREQATEKDAELLDVEPGTWLLRRTMLKHDADGVPILLQRSAMAWDLAGSTKLADPGWQPWPGGLIAEMWHLGYEWTRTVDVTGTRNPDDDERRLLRMETLAPVLDVERVFWAKPIGGSVDDARPMEASRVIGAGSRFRLRHETRAD
jgi:GntR family transcriptional regulator